MQQRILQLHQGLARLLLLGLVIQVYLATAPLFGVAVTFQPHRMLGSVLAILVILLLVLALTGRLGRQLIRLSLLLVFLTIVQMILPSLRGSISWVAALHAVNALALIRISIMLARPTTSNTGVEAGNESAQPTAALN
jgi:hypothetical protein